MSPDELVSEITILLDQGNICYFERSTKNIIPIEIANKKVPEVKEQINQLEEKIEKYIKFVPIPTQDLILVMKDFLLEVTDKDIERQLNTGLKRKKPTRNFLQIVQSRIDINQHWSLFMAERYEKYTASIFIEDYNY